MDEVLAAVIQLYDNTLKKFIVDPPSKTPYLISVCLAKSSADSIGLSKVSTVKKAAKLAVYEAIIISVKKYHIPHKSLLDKDMGATSEPCCIKAPIEHQKAFGTLRSKTYVF